MKTWKTCFGRKRRGKALLSVLAGLSLALGTASAATPAAPRRQADPFERRGATRLMDRTPPERLPSATNSPMLAPLVERWNLLTIKSLRYQTLRGNRTVNLAVHRIRTSPGRPVLVLIHGLLSDHLTWQYVAAALAADYELWLVDLPGCGESDAPKPSALEPDGYSPTAMGERVWQALGQCLAAEAGAPPRRLTLVGHSLGGTVVIRMLSAHDLRARYATAMQHIDRAVLLAPCDLAVNAMPPSFLPLLGLKGWMVTVGDGLGVIDGKMRDLTKASYHLTECATLERQQSSAHVLEDAHHRQAAQAMLRQFVRFDPRTLRPVWPSIDPLVAEYKNIRVPVLIVYGNWDETLSSAMGHQLKDEIPGAVLVKLPGHSHSLPTEAPAVCASLIRRFQQGQTPVELATGLEVEVYPATLTPRPGPLLSSAAASRLETKPSARSP
jgi:pimeloyl-ACP methyl ester carboxylesterase